MHVWQDVIFLCALQGTVPGFWHLHHRLCLIPPLQSQVQSHTCSFALLHLAVLVVEVPKSWHGALQWHGEKLHPTARGVSSVTFDKVTGCGGHWLHQNIAERAQASKQLISMHIVMNNSLKK